MLKLKDTIQAFFEIPLIKRITRLWYLIFLGIASFNRFFSIFYHILSFFTFSREQQAVLRGRYKYYRNLKRKSNSRVELRRNIHRIEKGLLMRPGRDSFARNYIQETIISYKLALQQYSDNRLNVDSDEINWAHDVLMRYFSTVKLTDKIRKAKNEFETQYHLTLEEKTDVEMAPYKIGISDKSPVTYDDLLNLNQRRKSVRWFKQKNVPRDLIDKAIMVACQSPSACNRLPYEYRIFDDPERVKEVGKIPFGASGYYQNIPVIVVIIGKLNHFFSSRDRHIIYIDASLSAMSFMLALETLGLSSSVINWPDFEPVEMKMKKTLKLKIDERPVMLIAVGYPDPEGKVAFSQRKSLNSIRNYNQT